MSLPRSTHQWTALAVLAVSAAEVALRTEMQWRPVALFLGVVVALATWISASHPTAAVVVGFVAIGLADLAAIATGADPLVLGAAAIVVVLLHLSFRRDGTWRPLGGLAAGLAAWGVAVTGEPTSATDAVGGLAVLLLASASGAILRYRSVVREQVVEQVRSREREALARDLHDTVAHHVTAMAVQAQAGQVLIGAGDTDGAAGALRVIEQEAATAMTEMRQVVGALRSPSPGPASDLAAIDALADRGGAGPDVVVTRHGDLTGLSPATTTAIVRAAREAVANARRHAHHARAIRVDLTGTQAEVGLTVTDDGDRHAPSDRGGFGLIGMAERVELLGGSFFAGPATDRGWAVRLTIPVRR